MNTPALAQLMGAYLHQDYDYAGTVQDNVDLFVREDKELAAALPAEVDGILATPMDESQLETLLDDLGCQLLPPDHTSYRTWLTQIAAHVRAATAGG